ncbi:MAG: hypothetical protein ABWY37_00715 [Microbacterium pygmaeum]
MTAPDPYVQPATTPATSSSLVRAAIWVAIGALIAAAIVCVIWVLIGTQNGIVGRAFLTILLLAAFAGVAIIDAHLAARRPAWFALVSMITWVVTLLLGAVLIWMPDRYEWGGSSFRFIQFLLIVLVLQLALLHVRLYFKAFQRHVTPFSQTVYIVTTALVVALAAMLVIPLVIGEWVDFVDLYWRFVVAVTILAAVGTALLPLTNALFAPKRPRPDYLNPPPVPQVQQQWPTYADGHTPLPVMPDGSPDWNAYYTGYPTQFAPPIAPPQTQTPPPPSAPAGYEGFPPPPPLPPRQ